MNNFFDLEKNAYLLLMITIAIVIISTIMAPFILPVELDNIFKALTVNNITNHLITTNTESTYQPPLFFWIINIFNGSISENIQFLKIIPALAMASIIYLTYIFIEKNMQNKTLAITSAIILATCPIFIFSSKILTPDLIYVLIYIASTFIFAANIYNNQYSNLSSIIAGALIGIGFCLEGFNGLVPLIINYLLINIIRGGFFINLKFNNPLFIALGFIVFSSIWVTSLTKELSYQQIVNNLINTDDLKNILSFEKANINTGELSLIILSLAPWIVLLPTCIICLLKTAKLRFNTSSLRTSLPLIAAINVIFLVLYYINIEQKFYIILTASFYLCIIFADRLTTILTTRISNFNYIYFIAIAATITILANYYLNIYKINHLQNSAEIIKQYLGNNNSITHTVTAISILTILAAFNIIVYATKQKYNALILSIIISTITLVIISFGAVTMLNKQQLESPSYKQWSKKILNENFENVIFYKDTNISVAQTAYRSFYFDNLEKVHAFTSQEEIGTSYIFYNKKEHKNINPPKKPSCLNNYCLTQIK